MSAGDWGWVFILGFEVWATLTGHQTLSGALWKHERGRRWLRVIFVGALIWLVLHIALKPDNKIPVDPVDDCDIIGVT